MSHGLKNSRVRSSNFIRRALNRSNRENILALYGVQAVRYVLPLITIPFLARTLGPAGFGLVVSSQAFALWLALILDYGFPLSATRDVARHRLDLERVRALVSGVAGAKALLLLASAALTIVVSLSVPLFREHPGYTWWAWAYGVSSGLYPLWYFQGIEALRPTALLDAASRSLAILAMFLFVGDSADGWKVLACQAVFSSLATALALRWLYTSTPWQAPSLGEALTTLRRGWRLFLYRLSVSFYTTANMFVLGLFVAPTLLGFYGGAEKLTRAFISLTQPLSQLLFPKMNHLVAHNPAKATELIRISLKLMAVFGCVAALGVYLLAPMLVGLLLGPDFSQAVTIMRILSLMIPVVALATVLGTQWMIPLGLDREFNVIAMRTGILSLLAVCCLTPLLGIRGAAWILVTAEASVTVSIYLVLKRRGLDPFDLACTSQIAHRCLSLHKEGL